MTRSEAATVIAVFVKAYPSQARDEAFLTMMSLHFMNSGVRAGTMLARAIEWVRTERFWPAISDMVEPEPVEAPVYKLIAPSNPIPPERGLEILKEAICQP